MGGVKWVSNPHIRKNDKVVYLPDVECSYPPKEGPLPPVEGGSIPSNEETRINSKGTRVCSSKKMGGMLDKPPKTYLTTALGSLGISPFKTLN